MATDLQPMVTAERFNQFAEYMGLSKLPGFEPGRKGELVEAVIHRWEALAIKHRMADQISGT